uniref:hypothetical protein n=1 Tax=uncultured Draconibacterium sp. TaxID=1573823 RepID=UPI003216FBC9
MKKYIFLPLLLISALCWGQAQFVVQNNAKTEVYNNINTAIENAVAGDTLYLPGGGFTISNTTIDKSLHWVGHGHYPSETKATIQTRITTGLNFTGNCDNSSFEGIYFTSTLQFGYDEPTKNVMVKRCRFGSDLYLQTGTLTTDLNFQIKECVLANIRGNNASDCTIEKSLIFGIINYMVSSDFYNNSINIYEYNGRTIQNCKYCTFENNVFGHQYGLHVTTDCKFYNNIFSSNLPYSETDANANMGINNIYNVGPTNIYTDISHSAKIYTFSYNNDYHLNASSTGTYELDGSTKSIIGSASDGANTGIFGTANPYKTIPYYPHINTAIIAREAISDQLGVTISVEAQSR